MRPRDRTPPAANAGSKALSVGLVAVLAGGLFVWNASSNQGSDLRDAPGLRGMVTARDREVEELQARQAELAQTVEALVGTAASDVAGLDADVAMAAGALPVEGPGLTITLDDSAGAPGLPVDSTVPAADLLVHQQDVDAVINALWAGGAEAMAVQDHRIGSTAVVKCVGNVILVGGRVHSPPYRITAIGPIQDMRDHLDSAPLVRAYRERASRLSLGWSTTDENELTIPGDTAASSALRYAQAIDSTAED
ncbi:MAG: DUF881 domain-containing protein [Bifidobacteriaceae bacterium]|jgi:uncharacterized protein YlxW (UPF0749 family)|nr:DUF881 domain-containing protein [Bifidobacteriaceae bacterium]